MEELNQNKSDEQKNFEFMQEQIKERPLNKKKLLRRTVITASMAAVFGMVACLTFLVLEPVISNWLYPEKEAENIVFPPETEEMLPEDMVLDDNELEQNEEEETFPPAETHEDELEQYQKLYTKIGELTKETSRALVTVTGVTSDMDWFDNTYESTGQTTGLIVADNGKEYLVLVDQKPLEDVESINVAFCDGSKVTAEMKMADPVTGLAVLTIDMKAVTEQTAAEISIAGLGSSNAAHVVGSPVIAMGSPMGNSGSVVYGTITSAGNVLNTVDSSYRLITTDIYGSQSGTGVLINLKGQVIGVINQNYNSQEMKNMIAALGISELKVTIERLSNGKGQAFLGIHGTDVTAEANQELKVPFGTYVTEIEMDSPAMLAGIQSGDVIIQMGGNEIESYGEYIEALSKLAPDSTTNITVMRQNQDEYKPMNFDVTLGQLE